MATMGKDKPMVQATTGWIDAARQGDAAALGQALEAFREYLTLVASRGIGPGLASKAGASDLVQETFLAAQRGIAQFRGSTQAEWRAWLEAILTNQLANFRRSYMDTGKRRTESALPPGEFGGLDGILNESFTPPSRRLQNQERDAAIEVALSRLPEHYRQVIGWHHDDGLTFEVIGSRLGISADGARKLWGRALVCLKRELGPDHDPR
jgi:RNA polymerase sigma-70 factor, ECF subfamily